MFKLTIPLHSIQSGRSLTGFPTTTMYAFIISIFELRVQPIVNSCQYAY
jgi:hypothetical protein